MFGFELFEIVCVFELYVHVIYRVECVSINLFKDIQDIGTNLIDTEILPKRLILQWKFTEFCSTFTNSLPVLNVYKNNMLTNMLSL